MDRVTVPGARPARLGLFFLLSIILLLAFILRLHNLDAFSFWTDEGLTPLRSGYSIPEILSNRIIIQEGITNDTHPPLFYLLIHASRRLLGESDFAYRYPSLLAGLLLVPLLFQFGRRLQGIAASASSLGFVAALLAAINPLHIWYANEARMYTLFVLLAGAMSYTLWRALQLNLPSLTTHQQAIIANASQLVIPSASEESPARRVWPCLILYIILATLAFYTHYTAAFLIAAQALFWAWLLWRLGQRRLIIATAAIALLVAIPLIPFTIPRLFTGAEASYSYVSPLIMLQDVVRFFALGLTVDFSHFTIQLLTLGTFLLLVLGLYATPGWLQRLFLLSYLLAIILGLMLGSLIKPMYQGVRHIMAASPAFLLLLAWGITWLGWKLQPAKRQLAAAGWAALAALALLIVATGSITALNNLYWNEQYAKDSFRDLIRYVERRAGSRDAVVYHNAILLPLHAHYQQRSDLMVTASPIYPHAAAAAPPQLEQLVENYDRIWFVTDPPADKRDEHGFVHEWLDENLTLVGQQPFHARTTVVGARVYDSRPVILSTLPEGGQPLEIRWPDLPPLAGIALDFAQPSTLPTLWFDLFWHGVVPSDVAIDLRFSLRGPDGKTWLITDQPLKSDPSRPWSAETLNRQSYHLAIPTGTPPGTYTLFVQPVIAADTAPMGEIYPLTEIQLAAGEGWPVVSEPSFINNGPLLFENGVILQGIELADDAVRPGHNLPLTLYWRKDAGRSDATGIRYELDVITSNGELLRTQSAQPTPAWLATWPQRALIREDTSLYIHPETPPGRYHLRWRLFDDGVPVAGRPWWRPWSSEQVFFGEVTVQAWPLVTVPPVEATIVQADYGTAIQLYGYQLAGPENNTLRATLYWQAQTVPAENYHTFLHLVSAADGTIVSQAGYIPGDGLRPTRGWRAGEFLTDSYTLALPADLPPGDYYLNVGLWLPDTGQRLPVTYQGQPQPDHQLRLETIRVP